MSKGKNTRTKIRPVKESLWKMIDRELDRLQALINEEKKQKQVA